MTNLNWQITEQNGDDTIYQVIGNDWSISIQQSKFKNFLQEPSELKHTLNKIGKLENAKIYFLNFFKIGELEFPMIMEHLISLDEAKEIAENKAQELGII